MDESLTGVESAAAPASPGIGAPTGQAATGTPEAPKNPTPDAAPPGQGAPATPAKSYRFKSQDEAERAHSELQSRYSRLGDPEQAAGQLALLTQLRSDPKFREWAQARLAEQEAGSGDPETVKALEIVQRVAREQAQQLIAPYAAQAAAMNLAGVFQAMTQKYGKEWEDHKDKMAEVFADGVRSGEFSLHANTAPSLKFVDKLYRLARSEDPEWGAKEYAKKLAQKKEPSIQSSAGTAPAAVAAAPTKGMRGAYLAALKEHGLG